MQDVYERAGGVTTLVSQGPGSANGPFPATFKGASRDGTRVFFDTSEHLAAIATGIYPDIYERHAGTTTFISVGPTGGNGDFFAFFAGVSDDGTRLFFETDEALVAGDTDISQDVYSSSIMTAGTRARRAPGRCACRWSRPTTRARRRTACTGRRSRTPRATRRPSRRGSSRSARRTRTGARRTRSAPSGCRRSPATPAPPPTRRTCAFTVSITDVRLKSDLSDYTGELELAAVLRITDKLNGTAPVDERHHRRPAVPGHGAVCRERQYDDRLHVLGEHDGRCRPAGRHRRGQADDLAARGGAGQRRGARWPCRHAGQHVFATQGLFVP